MSTWNPLLLTFPFFNFILLSNKLNFSIRSIPDNLA